MVCDVMNEGQIIKELAETAERGKSNTHQIEEIKENIKEIKTENKALYELTTSVKLIAQDMSSIKEDISEVKKGQVILSEKMDTEISKVKDEQDKICQKISSVENQEDIKKGKKWDTFWSKIGTKAVEVILSLILGGVLGAGIAYIANK